MASAAQLRQQIDSVLAGKTSAHLALAPRLVAPGFDFGYASLDAILRGGLPVAGTTEILGSRSSGRTTLAMAYLAERTREGHICAWIDVSGDLAPEAALADGIDLDRVLWIRCSGISEPGVTPAVPLLSQPISSPALHLVANASPPAKPNLRPYNPTRSSTIGTPGAANRPLAASQSNPRTVQVATDRLPARRGTLVLHKAPHKLEPPQTSKPPVSTFVKPKKPWSRLEQAIKSVDLLVQAGGFGTIILDLGNIAPSFVRRIPLATWFRWRSALERARTSLIVLTQTSPESQQSCSGSAAELVLRLEPELPASGTVLTGLSYRMEIVRRRFETQPFHQPSRKRPSSTATAWQSQSLWNAS